jgi:aspartate/glutamate racemase
MSLTKRVFLIHAVTVAIDPINDAFKRLWPEARPFNLLEDSLSGDLETAGTLTPELEARLAALARYAESAAADGILFTCSAFGEGIEKCRDKVPIPIFKPSEAMVEEALELGSRVAVLATFAPAIKAMSEEFQAMAAGMGRTVEILPYTCPEAMTALRAGDVAGHDRLIAEMAAGVQGADVLCFAQFSMTSAGEAARAASTFPVLTTPDSAVLKLRKILCA